MDTICYSVVLHQQILRRASGAHSVVSVPHRSRDVGVDGVTALPGSELDDRAVRDAAAAGGRACGGAVAEHGRVDAGGKPH